MARVSRKKGAENAKFATKCADSFLTALYVRLSVEDNGKKDADSIENQEALLREYLSERPYLFFVDIYIDNGYTGTDFDRPAFNRMMEDVRGGKINCIVVKDLSRLGRNYVEAGEYIEKIFPFFHVRFISVNDNYDSAALRSGEELSASLKNLVNDVYAKDISRKVGTAMKEKRLRGEYIGNYAPYGYLKDPRDKNHLIPDPETVPYVIEIFEMRASGMGITTILRQLNKREISSPGRLRFERGIVTNNNKKGADLPWNRHVLNDLLRNVAYIGHLAQGRSACCLYKGIPFHHTDPSEWDYVENTHEPIISAELWEKVQEINNDQAKKANTTYGKYASLKKRENPYGILLKCADCGLVIKQVHSYDRKRTAVYYNYKCPNNIELGDTVCPKKNIRASDLDEAVLQTIRKQMEVFLDRQKVLQRLIATEREKVKRKVPTERIDEVKKEIETRQNLCTGLYTDLKDGLLTQEEYLFAKQKYQDDIAKLQNELKELMRIRIKSVETTLGERRWDALIAKYYKAKKLSATMVKAMIKEIRLHSDNRIEIDFRYMNEFEELLQECERIRKEVA